LSAAKFPAKILPAPLKTTGTIIALLAIGLAALGLHAVNQASQLSLSSDALKSANDEIARLQQQGQSSEQTVRELQAEVQQLRAAAETQAPAFTGPQSYPTTAPSSPAPALTGVSLSALINGQPVAQVDASMLADFDANAFFSGQGPAAPQDLSKAAIQVLQTARDYDGYLGPHGAMNADLQILATVSTAILHDDGSNPDATAKMQMAFTAVVNESISRAATIANRISEKPDAVQQSQQLQQMLGVIKARQGP
jgi:hypothetical protein